MYSIDILIKEHEIIIDFTNQLKAMSLSILRGNEVEVEDFKKAIYFSKNFADKYHHQKEEKILFRVMMETLPPVATQLIRGGMMVEHDLGRLHVKTILEAVEKYEKIPSDELKLDIIANSICYGALLARHIDKEDEAVYQFAIRSLSEENMKIVENETHAHENNEQNKEVYKNCLAILQELKDKYNG
ncbi:MAG: hemerythrin domain-containing protein [Spirochaetaceae bacterium]|nr:hemerythrin domain-containing protein [Spirochaetaceae bacterium]